MYGELQCSSDEYNRMTMREYLLRKDGYERRYAESWRHTRWLGYQVIKQWADPDKLPTMIEIMPLPGDPTEEEIKAEQERQKLENKKWADELVEKMLKNGKLKKI